MISILIMQQKELRKTNDVLNVENIIDVLAKLKNADSGVDKGDKDCQTIPKQIKLGLILQYTNDLG